MINIVNDNVLLLFYCLLMGAGALGRLFGSGLSHWLPKAGRPAIKLQWKASSTMVPLPPHEEGQTITPQNESLQRAGKNWFLCIVNNICQHNPFTLMHCTARYAQAGIRDNQNALLACTPWKLLAEPLGTVLACATLPFSWTSSQVDWIVQTHLT